MYYQEKFRKILQHFDKVAILDSKWQPKKHFPHCSR